MIGITGKNDDGQVKMETIDDKTKQEKDAQDPTIRDTAALEALGMKNGSDKIHGKRKNTLDKILDAVAGTLCACTVLISGFLVYQTIKDYDCAKKIVPKVMAIDDKVFNNLRNDAYAVYREEDRLVLKSTNNKVYYQKYDKSREWVSICDKHGFNDYLNVFRDKRFMSFNSLRQGNEGIDGYGPSLLVIYNVVNHIVSSDKIYRAKYNMIMDDIKSVEKRLENSIALSNVKAFSNL